MKFKPLQHICFMTMAIVSFSFILVPMINHAMAKEKATFRKTIWGMSIEEVKISESLKKFKQGKDVLFFYGATIALKNMTIWYHFIDNQLVRAGYLLKESYINKNHYIDDYEYFKKILTEKYGRPKTDETFWKNELFKDNYSDWGRAVSIGHLAYRSVWETPCTEIVLGLTGDNFGIGCLVAYTGKNFVKLIEKKQKQENSASF